MIKIRNNEFSTLKHSMHIYSNLSKSNRLYKVKVVKIMLDNNILKINLQVNGQGHIYVIMISYTLPFNDTTTYIIHVSQA